MCQLQLLMLLKIQRTLKDLFMFQLLVLIQTHSLRDLELNGLVNKKSKLFIQMLQSFVQHTL